MVRDHTLTQAAKSLKTSVSTVWQWENGAMPRAVSLRSIAKYLGITMDEARHLWQLQRKIQ